MNPYLSRPEHHLETTAFRHAIEGRSVLVFGAGGSIGSAVARRVLEANPSKLSLATNTEEHLYRIMAELSDHGNVSGYLCDIRDQASVRHVYSCAAPSVVFNAAALKHIPLVENAPCEAILTNVQGAENVLIGGLEVGAERIVYLSTDKAVRPSSVMGATKRLAELLHLAEPDSGVRIARLVNVLGSSGSVLPLFHRLAHENRPITVTSPEMARYFITLEEAADFLLLAAASPAGRLFVPECGEPVTIMALAGAVLEQYPDYSGPGIQVTGIRPGEKVSEALAYDYEGPWSNVHGIMRSAGAKTKAPSISRLVYRARAADQAGTMELLREMVTEYRP